MSEKDFLSQFSGSNNKVPESFKQEERKPVVKPKKPVNKVLIIVLCILLLAIGIGAYFIFFAPKIEMPNFAGKTKNDVAAWVKQQGIETSGILFEEDYYFDYDEGTIISQSVEAGKKVKENAKINFVSSLGADPDELVATPDLMNMTKSEIQEWISANKLTKTKITTSYSEEVEEGNVISFAYSGCEEDTFTRSSTLKISVSKGPAPAGTISVEDFTKKTYEAAQTWADSKKITLTKTEQYSETVSKGYIISQSIASGKTMKENEELNVVVSLGKGIVLPDFTTMTKEKVEDWLTANKDYAVTMTKEKYSYSDAYIIEQSVAAGKTIGTSDSVILTKNLGTGFYIDSALIAQGSSADKVIDWAKEMKEKGLEVKVNTNDVESELPKGQIVSSKIKDGDTKYTVYEKLPIDCVITLYVSTGKTSGPAQITLPKYEGMTCDEATKAVTDKGLNCTVFYRYDATDKNKVISQSPKEGTTVDEGSEVYLEISKGNEFILSELIREDEILGHSFEEVVAKFDELKDTNDGLIITVKLDQTTPDTQGHPVNEIYINNTIAVFDDETKYPIDSVIVLKLSE